MSFLEIIQANDIQKIREEIAKGGLDENLLFRALILAAEKGYLEIVQILLEAGINPNKEIYNETPLGAGYFKKQRFYRQNPFES